MRPRLLAAAALLATTAFPAPLPVRPAEAPEPVDSTAIARIIDEGSRRSQVMQILSWLTDVYGPRLTWSPAYRSAADWAVETLSRWGLAQVRLESWTPLGHGWTLRSYSANVVTPQPFPLLSYPKAWSPGSAGTVSAGALLLEAPSDSALEKYRGSLKGKFVLLGNVRPVTPQFAPLATRITDSTLLTLANAGPTPPRGRRRRRSPENIQRRILESRAMQLATEEEAAAVLTPSSLDGGTIVVQDVYLPTHPDSPLTGRPRTFEQNGKGLIPQIAVAAEHYNRLVRILRKGRSVRLEISLKVEFAPLDSGYNVFAEIPGTDLGREVVMIGAHLDSWHGGTGATDNGAGVAVAMEAMRILQALGMKPRRTIRIGLWGGEEQGLFGSRDYVTRHLVQAPEKSDAPDHRPSPANTPLSPEGDRFSCYFNLDNGAGRIRGVYLQGQEELRPVFRAWLEPFNDMGASTVSPASTFSTDHISFTSAGLPGFQFIQDDIEYFTRTWHTTMDVYDRAQEDDLKQAAMILASFAYTAAMRDGLLPRRAQASRAGNSPAGGTR